MVSVVLGMLFCLGLALAVMALVAVPARRAGRDAGRGLAGAPEGAT